MYHKLLDRWDERRAQRGGEAKVPTPFTLGSDLAFGSEARSGSLAEFCDLAEAATLNPSFFSETTETTAYEMADGWIKFSSSISTQTDENNTVWAKVTEGSSSSHTLIVFHHWNARTRYRQIANFFSKRGQTVVEIAMPYHHERSRPGSAFADHMLSPNLGLTVQSVRQAVLDGRKLVRILDLEGYEEISVLGMSLGSWVAGLVAAHDPLVKNAALFLTAGSLADMVWTGRATQHIRASFEGKIELQQLRAAWGPLNLENYAMQLARRDLNLELVLGTRDTVVLPKLSRQFIATLEDIGAKPRVLQLNCGHYSLSLPPYIVRAGFYVSRLLNRPT